MIVVFASNAFAIRCAIYFSFETLECDDLPDGEAGWLGFEITSSKCYEMFAKRRKDISFCEKATDSSVKDDCYNYFADTNDDPSLCEKISNKSNRYSCYVDFAKKVQKASTCEEKPISQLAKETNISLFSVGFSEGRHDVRSGAATDGRPHLIEGKMIVSGSYDNFQKFTHKLFRMKRLYTFKTFDLTKSEQEKSDDEEAVPQDLMLSGVISFAYGYIPGVGSIPPTSIGNPINFDLINTVMNATANTEPLVTEKTNRPNPFLP